MSARATSGEFPARIKPVETAAEKHIEAVERLSAAPHVASVPYEPFSQQLAKEN